MQFVLFILSNVCWCSIVNCVLSPMCKFYSVFRESLLVSVRFCREVQCGSEDTNNLVIMNSNNCSCSYTGSFVTAFLLKTEAK